MSSLIQTVMDALPPELISRIGDRLGESPGATSKGFTGAAAALLAGAADQASTMGGASQLLNQVNRVTTGGNPLDNVGAVLAGAEPPVAGSPQDAAPASGLLGGHMSGIVAQLASFAGLRGPSASAIIGMAAPLVMGAIGRLLGSNPTPAGLQSLLAGQRSDIMGALPGGIRSLFGTAAAAPAAAVAAAGSGAGRLLPWLLAAVVLLALVLFGMRTCARKEVTPVAGVQTPATVQKSVSVLLNLPGGGSINVPQDSIGFVVAKFLESSDPVPKTFIFKNLNFDTASNAVTPESKPTVDALATVLKAYPTAEARVVGYTDNQGDPAANKTLSDARATAVKNELVALGVTPERIEKAGMGEANPIGNNATEEGRAENRRTELVIVKK